MSKKSEKNGKSILVELTNEVKQICSRGVSSPIEISKVQIRIENEILDLRLAIAQNVKTRAVEYYSTFRAARWDGDTTKSYNEASAEAKSKMAKFDLLIAEGKAYRDYFENLGSIIKSFQNSYFRD